MSDLNAEHLNQAVSEALGEDGITRFSAILSSQRDQDRYAVALHTLETPAHRVMALGSSEQDLQEARASGITRCVHVSEALRHAST
jgi:hypothetical protein